jgi:hypothetical protein
MPHDEHSFWERKGFTTSLKQTAPFPASKQRTSLVGNLVFALKKANNIPIPPTNMIERIDENAQQGAPADAKNGAAELSRWASQQAGVSR